MKLRSKFASISLMIAFAFMAIFAPLTALVSAKADAEPIPMDMYLIAGQSNAAGYSPIGTNQTEQYDNVWYAGQNEKYLRGASAATKSDNTQNFGAFKQKVTAGLGVIADRIGPEYGMASVLESYATAEKPVFIFKTAAGGTSLLDTNAEHSKEFGNWYPRSLWEAGYDPQIDTFDANGDLTGVLYKLFVENFRRVYTELVNNGYQPTVKGMVWMQGECDLYTDGAGTYTEILKTFITDIRNDLSEITGDVAVQGMPFVIGEIATTFGAYNNPSVPAMLEKQRAVAAQMNGVATVPTEDLIIVNEDGTYNGPDLYHFAFNDAKTLGIRFAQSLLELDSGVSCAYATNGGVRYEVADGNLVVTLTPDDHYKLHTLLVNGVDVASSVQNGVYTVPFVKGTDKATVVPTFIEKDRLTLTYEKAAGADFQFKPTFVYEGETVALKVYVNEDYKLLKVLLNGTELTANAEGLYEVTTQEAATLSLVTEKTAVDTDSSSDSDSVGAQSGGCNSAIGSASIVGGLSLLAGVVFLKRRDRK